MKIIYIIIISLFFGVSFNAQKISAGVKAGLNFVQQPKIDTENSTLADIKTKFENESTAFHIGFYTKVKLVGLYIRPELYYSHYKSEFLDAAGSKFAVESNRLDLPVLVGYQLIKTVFIHGGLVAQFYFGDETSLMNLKNSEYDDFKFGFQIGSGLELSKFTLEGRYEGAFSKRQIQYISENSEYDIESNPSQFLISVGYRF